MTFVASVVAKKGVAIIADSLVTYERPIIHLDAFTEYLKTQPKTEDGDSFLNPTEIRQMFRYEPLYAKDYEEKLFMVNKFTAITTAGAAQINSKRIADIIEEFKASDSKIEALTYTLEELLDTFKAFINIQVKAHLTENDTIAQCIFIITNYDKVTHKTRVFKITINDADNTSLGNEENNYITLQEQPSWIKVVCDGQNKISDQILYGSGFKVFERLRDITENIIEEFGLPDLAVTDELIEKLEKKQYFTDLLVQDMEVRSLTNLSLQQAVDLASLLMKIEVDFQKYTKNIPTVGGVIKLAVIDDNGFRFISGDNIEPPKHIHV